MTSHISRNQVKDIVARQLMDKMRLAYFAVNQDMQVCGASQNLVEYGFPKLHIGDEVEEKIDFMIGMDPDTSLDLPFVNSPSGVPICVNMLSGDDQLTVLISDATDSSAQREKLQQAANENELLVEQQKRLMSSLEVASQELEEKNRQLEEASRLQSSFLSGVSHEFRTPLTSIIGYTNLVKRDIDPDFSKSEVSNVGSKLSSKQSNEEYLDAVQRSSKHLLSLVENLLDHGKLDSDEIVIRPKPTSLVELFEDVELLLKPLSATKNIDLDIDLNLDDPDNHIIVDDSRLRQCLINLVGNAIKFTDFGGVTLRAKLENDTLDVVISDTGMGISKEDLKKIRLPFYQAADTGKVGTGLGLTITERIIEMMGGDMDIDSEVGKGTVVRFDLAAPSLNKEMLDEAPDVFRAISNFKVLLAEDDRDIADLVIMMLSEAGLDVAHVQNGALAVEAIQNNNFDLVLMDINMPIMTGYEAIEELNKLGLKTPIIVMSASSVESEQQKALELGCAAYLMKPVDVAEIIEMANTLID